MSDCLLFSCLLINENLFFMLLLEGFFSTNLKRSSCPFFIIFRQDTSSRSVFINNFWRCNFLLTLVLKHEKICTLSQSNNIKILFQLCRWGHFVLRYFNYIMLVTVHIGVSSSLVVCAGIAYSFRKARVTPESFFPPHYIPVGSSDS